MEEEGREDNRKRKGKREERVLRVWGGGVLVSASRLSTSKILINSDNDGNSGMRSGNYHA